MVGGNSSEAAAWRLGPAEKTARAAHGNARAPRARGVVTACGLRGRWHSRRWQGVADEHRWGPVEASGKKSGDGAHRDGRAAGSGRRGGVQQRRGCSGGRRCAWRGPAALVREGEPGVISNLGMVQLGGRSPERGKTVAALGKIRCEGEAPEVGGGGTGAEMVGRRAALEMGAGAGPVSREWTSGRGRALSGSVGGAAERERKERGGGPAVEVPRGAGWRRVAWPRPAGGALIVSQPAATRTR
jgi:hypothetical protein